MVKQVCDRCGKEMTTYKLITVDSLEYLEILSLITKGTYRCELCDECWEDFMRFLKQKPQLKWEEK